MTDCCGAGSSKAHISEYIIKGWQGLPHSIAFFCQNLEDTVSILFAAFSIPLPENFCLFCLCKLGNILWAFYFPATIQMSWHYKTYNLNNGKKGNEFWEHTSVVACNFRFDLIHISGANGGEIVFTEHTLCFSYCNCFSKGPTQRLCPVFCVLWRIKCLSCDPASSSFHLGFFNQLWAGGDNALPEQKAGVYLGDEIMWSGPLSTGTPSARSSFLNHFLHWPFNC